MSEEITFYTNPKSRGRTVHWLLEELGVPYRVELLDLAKHEQKAPPYLALNPMGKVPAIVHRGVVVTESAAICAYLADTYAEAGLAPALGDSARGTYLRWIFFAAAVFEPAVVDRLFKRKPVEQPQALGYGSYEDTLRTLETAMVPGPYILGERFSAADVFVGSELTWAIMAKAVEPGPAFTQYTEHLAQRPAFQRAVEQAQRWTEQLKARA